MGLILGSDYDIESIPDWWIRFIESIEDGVDVDGKLDPIVEFTNHDDVANCRLCNEQLWGKGKMYEPTEEWEHFKNNHEDIIAIVRLRCE